MGKFRRERKLGWLQNAKTLLIGTRNLMPLDSICRCSRTKEWNSPFAGSTSDPLTQPSSNNPPSRMPKEMESRIIVTSNDFFRTKTTQSLPNWRTRGDCREDGAHKILKEATTVCAEIFPEEATIYFFRGRKQTGPFQEMLLCNGPKERRIREHVRLPLFNDGQITTALHLL